jgi:flavin reductase (DIM6/NTAB) family NADH-FMN oxidoreductase RutF
MTAAFTEVQPDSIDENAIKLVGKDWMLVSAGDLSSFNMMTASWGGMGMLWNRSVAWCVIRPQRYTFQFVEDNPVFTLSFFDEKYRPILKHLGTKSGRDVDKINDSGLTAVETPDGGITFQEARLVMVCRKMYFQDLDPSNFLDESIHQEYPLKDYHRMYIGEIQHCLTA